MWKKILKLFCKRPTKRFRIAEQIQEYKASPEICDAYAEILKDSNLVVDLDGTRGMSSAFLREVFGGLIIRHGYTFSYLERHLELVSEDDPSYLLNVDWSLCTAEVEVAKQSKKIIL